MDWQKQQECPYCAHVILCDKLDDGLIVECNRCNRESIMQSEMIGDSGLIYWLLGFYNKKENSNVKKDTRVAV
jgi:hypothetical protein